MDILLKFVQTVNMYLSDYILIVLLIGTGIYFTLKTRFVQVRCFKSGLSQVFGGLSFKKKHGAQGLNSFQALATAVAAQVGTGNIVGACGAILTGGPGAIFWMWIIAFFGMATIYAEAVLAQETKELQPDGTFAGGPVYYIKRAFKGKFGTFLARFFAVSAVLALGFMGAMVQSNSIGEACQTAFSVPSWLVGIIIVIASGLIFIGGAKRISSVTEKMVPVMAILYIVGGLVVIVVRAKYLPETLAMIFKFAFRPDAIIGGSIGYALKTAVSQGAKRGLFSNEAGMGSTPHAHALADVKKPHDQGVAAMIGVFIDTFVVLTMTGLVVVSTLYAGNGILAQGNDGSIGKSSMAMLAFGKVMGDKGAEIFVAACLLFFAFSTIISWNYFGKINFEKLFGKKYLPVYYAVSLVFIFLGSIASNELVWECTDMFNQLMVIPNVIAIVALGSVVARSAAKSEKKEIKK